MQFRASAPPLLSSAALRRHDTAASSSPPPPQAGATSCSPTTKPPHVQPQPGTLRSINQSPTSQRRFQVAADAPSAAQPRSSKKRASAAAAASVEPIDYLQLRRTEQSKQALRRNRQVVHEILSPAPVPSPLQHQQQQPSLRADHVLPPRTSAQAALDEFARSCRDKGKVDSAVLARGMQQLDREHRRVEAQSQAAAGQLQELLADIRQHVSLPRSFAPLVWIYARHKLASRWCAWRAFVSWHRLEQQRLEHLAPHALRIQRVFRCRRTKWTRARARLALAWGQWRAALVLQCWARRCLRAQTRRRAHESLYAARLQAAWRGRQTRRQVKKALQERLRWMLAALSPTGNLHRLHEVLLRAPPELAQQVNHALSLVVETHVALAAAASSQHKPRHTAIAATHFAHPVEATRAQLFRAVHALRGVLQQRERDVAAAKHASVQHARATRLESEQHDAACKRAALAASQERLAEEAASASMAAAELETREHVRVLRTVASDARQRQQLRESRREHAERSLMLVEDYSTRYVVAETRRRALESRRRLEEVAKREQLLHNEEQRQLAELLAVLQQDERKRLEAQQRHAIARAAEQETWTRLSRDEKAQALRRLELLEQQRRQQQALEAREREARDAALDGAREKDALRAQRQLASARELGERASMGLEETRARRWHAEARKRAGADLWAAKREREKLRYSIDPMHFAHVQAQKQQEERERRERSLMALDDALGAAAREKERKKRHLQLRREQRHQRLGEEAVERAERALMQAEEQLAAACAQAARRSDAFRVQLQRMQAVAVRGETRENERLGEARRRTEMHDEELRQRRVQQAQALVDAARERRARQAMEAQERTQRQADAARAKLEDKRQRARLNLRMMREDVESMARQDWEDEGSRLEQLLWSPHDAAAFAHLVRLHGAFLRTNVEVLQELVGGRLRSAAPPLELDYDAVAHEAALPLDRVPRRPRAPRRFFYHEFFEADPILARAPPPPTADELRAEDTTRKARERWRMLARHFFGRRWSSEAARRGLAQLHDRQFAAAFDSLRAAAAECSSNEPALARQLARCCLGLWEATAARRWLHKALFFQQRAAAHVAQLASPAFLQELAAALEQAGSYRAAAEVLGGVIQCFPRYPRLAQVIFRGAVVMVVLRMFRQAREYLLHVLEARPFACWEPAEVQFLVARVLQLEGPPSRRLCEVAYEDAFQRAVGSRRRHATWRDWLRAPDTWRSFGDACFAKREFALARDAYQLTLRRQLEPPAHLASKRQQVLSRARREPEPDATEADDWLRLARVCAALGDRERTALALRRWFERKSYRARVLEQFCAWPLARWKLLGLEVPERVLRLREAKDVAEREAAAALRREVDAQRQQVLRQRSLKVRAVAVAWQQPEEQQRVGAVDTAAPAPEQGDAAELLAEPRG